MQQKDSVLKERHFVFNEEVFSSKNIDILTRDANTFLSVSSPDSVFFLLNVNLWALVSKPEQSVLNTPKSFYKTVHHKMFLIRFEDGSHKRIDNIEKRTINGH